MKNRKLLIGVLALFTIFSSSCKDETYDFLGDEGKVYVRIQEENMVNSVHNMCKSSISINSMGVFGEAKVEFPVKSTMPAQGTIEVALSVDNSLVSTYNQAHNTEYMTLKADMISFDNNVSHIQDGQMQSADFFKAHLDINKAKSLGKGEYLVPLRLQSSSSMVVSENWNTIYWLITISDGADGVPLADRSGWKILDFSTEDEYEENLAVNVLDGDLSTLWHTEWYSEQPEPPHFISIDMGKEVNLAGFQYVTRNRDTGAPAELTLDISVDGNDWTTVDTYTDLPTGVSAEFRVLFDEVRIARYFRLTITEMAYEDECFVSLAEINAFIANN